MSHNVIIVKMPLFSDKHTVALVFDPADVHTSTREVESIYDECGNLETAIQYAHDGFIVIAVAGDPDRDLTLEEVQQAIDHEQELVADCFGREVYAL